MQQIQHAQSLRDRDYLQVLFALHNVATYTLIQSWKPVVFNVNIFIPRI